MKHPFDNFRSLFPKLSDHVHLAACSGSALALPVAKAVDEYQNGLLSRCRLESTSRQDG
ncbi:hypothetical protein CHCC15290_3857 [Bacillus licheniformis]|nr:hypothetical protein CHCC20369_2753 [Bacillus licheniformis]TWN10698.1 hypothetical protein CHCC14564_3250 [Bacillus licheniformis LMG 17339]TWK36583.1 hypothetical protein CHCC20368_1108 [Bacillus licheniformis]TWK54270.1 hypothetical protein CHCC20344_2051 [Bacillus licheniformis]TWK73525.1 hypothetical protein CHCC20339_3146 [Bacillus licheniformis]